MFVAVTSIILISSGIFVANPPASLGERHNPAPQPAPVKPTIPKLSEAQIALLNDLETHGQIHIQAKQFRVLVYPPFWTSLDISMKENFVIAAAIRSAEYRGDSLLDLDIVDNQSGKKLGNWGKLRGLNIE